MRTIKQEHSVFMSHNPAPTIKGMFVKSHINALKNKKGEDSAKKLEQRYGKPIDFGAFEEVPVREEIEILEHVLDLINEEKIDNPDKHSFEAGRLHFRNFSTTTYGKMILKLLSKDLKHALLRSTSIATYIFKNVIIRVEEAGEKSVLIHMENNDYTIEHFRGLFYEWMLEWKYDGTVEAFDLGNGIYEYKVRWK